ncbi:hypothetical protein [Deinococcus frigens]|uniref:hypothetical protein n=1 Tax=Deinococcus frigens TaxID=249403 RepID=UPI0012EBC84E|nr:hypothetical protein [Deinococcus frigens]
MKKLGILGALLATMAISGFAGASGWGDVTASQTLWTTIPKDGEPKIDSIPVYDDGGASCSYSQWTESRTVNYSSFDEAMTAGACTGAMYTMSRIPGVNKVITTIINKSTVNTQAIGAGGIAGTIQYCKSEIQKYVEGLDTRTCTRSWNTYYKTCGTVCGSWY